MEMLETTETEHGPGRFVHIFALATGVPTIFTTLWMAFDGLFPRLTFTLAVMSALGCTFAVVGMRSRPRRFRAVALLLTILPGLTTIAGFALIVVAIVLFAANAGNPNS